MTFEVTKRRSPTWIVIVVFAGLLVGVLVRILFGAIIKKAQQWKRNAHFKATIAGIRSNYEDPDLRQVLNDVESRTTGDVDIQALAKMVADAPTATNTSLAETKAKLDDLALAIDGRWDIPETLKPSVYQLTGHVEVARHELGKRNAAAAKSSLDQAERKESEIKAQVQDWVNSYVLAATTMEEAVSDHVAPDRFELRDLQRTLGEAKATTLDTAADLPQHLRLCEAATKDWTSNVRPRLMAVVDRYRSTDAMKATSVDEAFNNADPRVALGKAAQPLGELLTASFAQAPGTSQAPGTVVKESQVRDTAAEPPPNRPRSSCRSTTSR